MKQLGTYHNRYPFFRREPVNKILAMKGNEAGRKEQARLIFAYQEGILAQYFI